MKRKMTPRNQITLGNEEAIVGPSPQTSESDVSDIDIFPS